MILALVVVIAIDQMRSDYLERFQPYFSSRGFNRLLKEGAVYPNARLAWANAETAPGHVTISSGLLPVEHGIIGNRWFDRDAPVNEAQWAWYFDDVYPYRRAGASLPPLPREQQWWRQGGSPRSAAEAAFDGAPAGFLRPPSPGLRVISLAHKETSARLLGGGAAYWFDTTRAGFVPETSFNALVPGYIPASRQWNRSPFIPPGETPRAIFDPPAAWPLKNTRYGGTFPHPVTDARALTYSPFGHEMLFDFALQLLHTEKPDVLFVSVSSTDNLGHYYGPDSMEVGDNMVRLDRALADFLDALERHAGDDLVVVLTSDHGIQPIPEIAKLRDPRADAGRIDLRNPDPNARTIADLPPLRIDIERRLAGRLRVRFDEQMPLRNALVYFFEGTGLYLNRRRVAELNLDAGRVKRELRDVVKSIDGVSGAWTSSEPLPALMRASFRADRSGDVVVALRPGWMWHWGSNSTTHGQPVDADLRVPLIFWGKGVEPGRYDENASPADIAGRFWRLSRPPR